MTSTHTTNLSHARHTNNVHFGSRFKLHPLKNPKKNNFRSDERTKAVMTTITAVKCRKTGRISKNTHTHKHKNHEQKDQEEEEEVHAGYGYGSHSSHLFHCR